MAGDVTEDFASSDKLARQVTYLEKTHTNIPLHRDQLTNLIIVTMHLKFRFIWAAFVFGAPSCLLISIFIFDQRQQFFRDLLVIEGIREEFLG